jgi:hypothetical protein
VAFGVDLLHGAEVGLGDGFPELHARACRFGSVLWYGLRALRELSAALAWDNEIVYREALSACATTGGTAATAGAAVPTVGCE